MHVTVFLALHVTVCALLQVLNRAGEFISVPCIPGTVLINIADLMQRWTSDVYVSAVSFFIYASFNCAVQAMLI